MIIRISDSAFTTTLSVGSTIADNNGFFDEYSTTVTCLTSSLSTQPANTNYIYVNSANHYINSLSNEQIVQLEERLAQKENTIKVGDKEFTLDQIAPLETTQKEKSKTYKKI